MQKNEPLIHVFYLQLQKLVMLLISNIIQKAVESDIKDKNFTLSAKIFDDNQVNSVLTTHRKP